jgi:hypothetical protein
LPRFLSLHGRRREAMFITLLAVVPAAEPVLDSGTA